MINYSLHHSLSSDLRFGELPPKLFTPLKWQDFFSYRQGESWVNPDGEYTDEERNKMLQENGGALRFYSENGFWGTVKKLGVKKFISEMKLSRVVKETLKTSLSDPNQDYTPYAMNSVWVHHHDRDHLLVSELPPIKMGKHEGVNGVDGISARIAPHFHPEDSSFKARYPGMLDEYRVAIHQYLTEPSSISKVRLLFYTSKMLTEVPNPKKAIRAHKASLKQKVPFFTRLIRSLTGFYRALIQFVKAVFRLN